MRRLIPLLCLLLAPVVGIAEDPHESGGKDAAHRSFGDVEHWAGVFDDPSRRAWQKPLLVLEYLGIQPGDVVADLGAGTGYFTGYLSLKVGDAGKVYAVDTEQAMLDHLMKRSDLKPSRVETVLAATDDPKLPDGRVDLVLIVNTWHHIEKRPAYLKRLARSLTPEGRVVVIDYREGDLPVGPPAGHKLSRETVVKEFSKARWTLAAESVALPYQYFLTFHPPKKRK